MGDPMKFLRVSYARARKIKTIINFTIHHPIWYDNRQKMRAYHVENQ
jgi:hypothetical protein